MPSFAYKARDAQGRPVTGTIDAETPAMVITRLQGMGYFPISVQNEAEAKRGAATAAVVAARAPKKVKVVDLATFDRQLADLLAAGIPLVKSLGIIENQTQSLALSAVVKSINADVSGGDSLAAAMAKHPKVFSKLHCAMVKSGEAGGNLDIVLSRLADFAELDADTRSKIKSALAYPVVMVIAGTGSVIVLMTVVMPRILGIFKQMNQAPPLPTQILIAMTDFMQQYWYVLVGGAIVLAVLAWRALTTPEGRRLIDTVLLKVPILGELIVKKEIANFARTLGSLLHNGVSILPALEITHEVLNNQLVADEVGQIPANVTQGEGVAGPLKKSKHFPPVVVNMIAVGEETGRLDEVLIKIARSYDVQVERSVKTLTGLIEPIIILAMGLVVGFIVMAMLLPIFSINPAG